MLRVHGWRRRRGRFRCTSNCLGAERQDEAPRHGPPGEREDRIGEEEIPPLRGLAGALLEGDVDECVCVDGKESWRVSSVRWRVG